ncbi:uncharacterized protein LOC132747896 [Ruditapes philippinarum]|uniref:uncharacterized protein LOC132747896 n=1 Tax=Ruditapes philippinarum TaxID=129788 RepID=UPI00295B80E5|nr:uncharacterized protein LOC132747896 [Ruditapes philippinarum]
MFILCNMTGRDAPDTVSLYYEKSLLHLPHEVTVVKTTQHFPKLKFSMCVSPLHSMFNDTTQLIEWIELNWLLGVERFIFYINSISQNVSSVLEYYKRKEIVQLITWNIPKYLEDDVHYYGQLAALNDCLYRNKGKSIYLSSTDLDEFIIPQKPEHFTWSDMMDDLPLYSVYIVRSSFFSCSKQQLCKHRMTIDSYNVRDNIILRRHVRSKYIGKTSELIVMGVHYAWEIQNGGEYTFKPEEALLHHYRRLSTFYTLQEPKKVLHSCARKYSAYLKRNIFKVILEIFNKRTSQL